MNNRLGAISKLFSAIVAGAMIACAPLNVLAQTAQRTENFGELAETLKGRVAPPHDETIAAYKDAGAEDTKPHMLTDKEWALVEEALANLPPLLQRILKKRLARLSFIDAPASAGTALTRMFEGPDGEALFEITLRADVFDKSLSEFLTTKEQMLFSDDGSGYSVTVSAGSIPALTYLLLHEASHVVDRTLGMTAGAGPFPDIWIDYRKLKPVYAAGPLGHSVYRRGPKLPSVQSVALYEAFEQAPFVSLYSTASAGEDFAELVAWHELSTRFGISLRFEVRDAQAKQVLIVEPLKSPAVQARLKTLDQQLEQATHD